LWFSAAGFLAERFDKISSGNKQATSGSFSYNRRLKRQQRGNGVAALLPLLTDLKNRYCVFDWKAPSRRFSIQASVTIKINARSEKQTWI
jgi:hypothetical protein